ncbi:SDR family NAD(P)-dependent oxidoreductase [Bradyrhizobium tropiciagri]|uniref:SDR family NAD(P)-dependent oxidoreductase n=1 Tax=Bradyrhizobium tropiciagri TaxID=312253 RepID=UPI001BA4BF47|nr:SDR family NAD(P)-dependent oxidoreductase [Bradyrhizobium tropiciagri]MBR0898934.1 SDR family NAD(P)-dependent oxidoreductase [Bradyrhizobium tropiciagri]
MQELKGKIAVITGGASGIGFAAARSLAREGVKLVIADIEQDQLIKAVASLEADGAEVCGVVTDVACKSSVEHLADQAWSRFGAVHICFNNAGVAIFGPTQSMTHADWQWAINVNLWGAVHGVETFIPRMIEQKEGGHVLFTSSFAGLISNRSLGPYSVSKAAVVALAECLSKDLREMNIGVTVLCPMRVETKIEQSYRNRPAELGGPERRTVYTDRENGSGEGRVLPVELVGDLVVDAIRRNALYVITHKETEAYINRRFDRLKEAIAYSL